MARHGAQTPMQDNKLVSIQPTASTGQVDYMGGVLNASDLAMYSLFNEDR